MKRAHVAQPTFVALRFLMSYNQSGSALTTGYCGFHFIDMHTGARTWHSDGSSIGIGFRMMCMLIALTCPDPDTPEVIRQGCQTAVEHAIHAITRCVAIVVAASSALVDHAWIGPATPASGCRSNSRNITGPIEPWATRRWTAAPSPAA